MTYHEKVNKLWKMFKTGWHIAIVALIFMTAETIYFQSEKWPKTIVEWICDISGMIASMTGTIMMCVSFLKKNKLDRNRTKR